MIAGSYTGITAGMRWSCMPAYGTIRTVKSMAGASYSLSSNFVTGAIAPTSAYNVSYSDLACWLMFLVPPQQ